MHAQIFYAVIL